MELKHVLQILIFLIKHYWFTSQYHIHDLKTLSDLHVKCSDSLAILTTVKLGPLTIKFKEVLLPKLLDILSDI